MKKPFLEMCRRISGNDLDMNIIEGKKLIALNAQMCAERILDKRSDTAGGGYFDVIVRWYPEKSEGK